MAASLLLALCVTSACAYELPVMPVEVILEDRRHDDDLAVVIPDRLELYCELGDTEEKGNAFAGFMTRWRGAIEFEVSGSGAYRELGEFSTVAISLDYGGKDGWIKRSFFGLGLIPDSRRPHRPEWGVRSAGKSIMRGNIIRATPEPQRVTIDPAQYAPKGWDGRLWIGLINHDVGSSTFVKARIVNALPPEGSIGPERDREEKWNLVRDHQRAFLHWRPAEFAEPYSLISDNVGEMLPYAKQIEAPLNDPAIWPYILQAAREIGDEPLSAEKFGNYMLFHFRWIDGIHTARRGGSTTAQELGAFLTRWRSAGSFGSEIGCIVRTASNLEKVGLADIKTGTLLGRNPEPVTISAARREHEGFQIVLTPLPGCEKKVSVSATDLKSDNGKIPSTNIKINPVGYIRIRPFDRADFIVPDPLLIGPIPDLVPGENQPVWVSIQVPEDAVAGEYSGNVIISGGGQSLRIPLALTVRDFELPKKFSLRSSFWLFRDQINRFYHLDEVELDDYLKWVDFALEYRVCPVDVCEGQRNALLRVVGPDNEPIISPDFSGWDRFIDRMVAGGAGTIHLGLTHHHGVWFADRHNPIASAGHIERLIQNLKVMREHYKRRGVYDLHYLQLRDETNDPGTLDVYRAIRERIPDLKLLLTHPSEEARPLLQIPCPITLDFDPEWRDEIKADGGEYWWYVFLWPHDPYANFLMHQTASQHRALFWQTWRNEVDGLLYWGLNFWAEYGYNWPETAKMPTYRLPPEGEPDLINNPRYPGDGVLMYPGPSPSQPMSSIRLETIRDGSEDFEYLTLLDKLISEAEINEYGGLALQQARAARAAARRIVPDLTNHEKNPKPYLKVRDQIAEAIERLMQRLYHVPGRP